MAEGLIRIPDIGETQPLSGKIIVITGTSRGIGREMVLSFVEAGARVVGSNVSPTRVNRHEEIKQDLQDRANNYSWALADVTTEEGRQRLIDTAIDEEFNPSGKIDYLVISASGGLEKDKPDNYAHVINTETPEALVDIALPYMNRGGKIILITSLPSLRYGRIEQHPLYDEIAKTKHDGEMRLRKRISDLNAKGCALGIVSGPFVEGTIMFTYFRRNAKRFVEQAREAPGGVISVREMADGVREMILAPVESWAVLNVGETDPSSIDFKA